MLTASSRPPRPDLQHRDVELRSGEYPQRGERSVLEIGERHVAARILDRVEGVDQRSVVLHFAVDLDALVVAE